ncbi:MAG: hypothetical protein L6R45_21975 [Anaerolineae bacterium]|nr:hypothetical protein [Anaerolineae bacterium]
MSWFLAGLLGLVFAVVFVVIVRYGLVAKKLDGKQTIIFFLAFFLIGNAIIIPMVFCAGR